MKVTYDIVQDDDTYAVMLDHGGCFVRLEGYSTLETATDAAEQWLAENGDEVPEVELTAEDMAFFDSELVKPDDEDALIAWLRKLAGLPGDGEAGE